MSGSAGARGGPAGSGHRMLRRPLLLLFVLAAVQAAYHGSQLPALSAAWFGASGEGLAYVPTWQLMWAHALLAGVLAAVFWFGPSRWVDVPESGRRPDPRDGLLGRWTWLGILTLLVLAALMEVVYAANRQPIPAVRPALLYGLLASWAAFVALWSAAYRRASRAARSSVPARTEAG